ncbi:RluA family pseudouridine synthase [Marinobacterium litorale]|uniref:RluA family pseudouridine synthase n=1 Tax=Marinobacterium litorale TaxID=404770 RepID=UPI00040828D6|nr:RluA family pseudouridine synthase [Marinobacterium litorale]
MKIEIITTIESEQAGTKATDFLAKSSELSRQRIKDAMAKGAVWLKRSRGRKRLRKATEVLKRGDRIELHYDDDLLSRTAPTPLCLHDAKGYSIWFKPAGLLSQGNDFGDHLSLLRLAEQMLEPRRAAFPVHRLDRETAGLMIVAHKANLASQLSALFREHKIEKHYRAWILGELPDRGQIDARLDGKAAHTRYQRLAYNADLNQSLADIEIDTGRTHQIRRHLAGVGHPVIGDPRYGEGNKNREGLQLYATQLAFECPLQRRPVKFELSDTFLVEHCAYRQPA